AMELAFAQPGSDAGLLPINSFLVEMEELSQSEALEQPLIDGIGIARGIVDEVFSGTANFSAEALAQLNTCVTWMQQAIVSLDLGETPLACPLSEPNHSTVTWIPDERIDNVEEKPIILNLEGDRELLQEFVNESREHLQNIESGALVLEDNPSDVETLNSIFR